MGLTSRAGRLTLGRGKRADDSMSAIQFSTTIRECLPQYSYIFKKPKPLGIDMKNVAWYRLGNMLHLDIQKGKETTKKSILQKDISEGLQSA